MQAARHETAINSGRREWMAATAATTTDAASISPKAEVAW
jgi:hypothetical protein